MSTRFFELRPGARFRFRGETYVKLSTLMARHEDDGSQRLIARSATVEPLDATTCAAASELPETLPSDTARHALDVFATSLATALAPTLEPDQQARLLAAIEQARTAALDTLAHPAA